MLLQYLTMTENTKVQRKYTSDYDDPWKWFSQFERQSFCFQGRLYNTVTKLLSTFNIYSIQTKSYTWNFAIVISFFLFKNIFFSCVWLFCLCICLCIICVPVAFRGQKITLDPWELELQVVMSHHMGAGKNSGLLKEWPVILITKLLF